MSIFPLLKLPESSVDTIVKQMEFHEIVKFCICSNQSAEAVKRLNPTFHRLLINFSHDKCNIWLAEEEYRPKQLKVTFHKSSAEVPNRSKMDGIEEYRYEVIDPAQKNANVARLIMDSINVKECWYGISPDNIENLKEYVTNVLVEDYNYFEVCGRKTAADDNFLDSEDLTFLMNTVKKNVMFQVMSNIPTDFKHEKALQFKSFHYIDDRWLTLDNLKSMRNVEEAVLSWTHFNWNDINQFLHYWMTCDDDMMRELFIYFKCGTVFNENELLHNLTAISCQVDRNSFYYIKARNDGNRKCTVGQLHFDTLSQCLRFKAIEPKSLPDDIYRHLEDVEKIQKLSRVKVDIENLGFEYQKMLENEKCDIEKGRIQRELEIVERTKHGINGQLGLVQNQWKPFLLSFLTGALRVLYPIGMNVEVNLSFDESD
ncbi:hypothetical protein CRE_01936 [Caenorhabditis remanei]|uniref:F-box domain-containing protein n=1 Tax=Caenorhabditis remanei TaxID=31234 RepID=E3LGE0_CAERE|nr:hypothetical protein CRE_01936 [Caenorhabditis remanei]